MTWQARSYNISFEGWSHERQYETPLPSREREGATLAAEG
jgi:hypothetical protein